MNSQDRAYTYLKNAIISLELRPGSAVRTEEISQKLKVSRTPVREALSRLEQDGFVIRERGWGYIVRPISHKEMLDLFSVREVLEVRAAVEAQPRLTERDHKRLALIIAEAKELLREERSTEFRLRIRDFHLLIASASENDLLHRLLSVARDRVLVVAALHQDMRRTRAREVLAENRRILQALISGNPREIKASVLAHIRNSRKSILRSSAGH